jgi:hypothetical protein
MSGGSYNYLYADDLAGDLPTRRADIERMRDQLATYPDGEHAAAATQHILDLLDHAYRTIGEAQDRLENVWRAVEWSQSGDGAPDQVTEALAKYNATTPPAAEDTLT